jgi:hypothetical protein
MILLRDFQREVLENVSELVRRDDLQFARAGRSLTGYPAESGPGGAHGATPKQLSAARCWRASTVGVNPNLWGKSPDDFLKLSDSI